jgi:hypothetical protein
MTPHRSHVALCRWRVKVWYRLAGATKRAADKAECITTRVERQLCRAYDKLVDLEAAGVRLR